MLHAIEQQIELGTGDHVVTSREGSWAELVELGGEERLRVRDAGGKILFEYHPESGKGVLSIPDGDLALHAPRGNIDLVSGKGVRCYAAAEVSVESATGVELGVRGHAAGRPSALRLGDRRMTLSSPAIGVSAESAEFLVARGRWEGEHFSATLEQAKLVIGKIETVAKRVVERAVNVYRSVLETCQLKAGRVRTRVSGSYYLKSETAFVKAEQDVKIDGEKIHLG